MPIRATGSSSCTLRIADQDVRVEVSGHCVAARTANDSHARVQRADSAGTASLEAKGSDATLSALATLYMCLELDDTVQELTLQLDCASRTERDLLETGAVWLDGNRRMCSRATLYQLPQLFCSAARAPAFPLRYVLSNDKRHPTRAPKQRGTVYRRYIVSLDSHFSLRVLTRGDLERLHRWMNEPRIARVWDLAGGLDRTAAYIDRVNQDAHTLPLIGCFDGEPFGYFEVYWVKEDRIAPFYAVDDYDRGVHVLSGEAAHRGPQRVAAWLDSLVHYAFLDDPRTRNVVAEPRADNAKMIGYFLRCGFHAQKTFELPHKSAAMMVLPREVFFEPRCRAAPPYSS